MDEGRYGLVVAVSRYDDPEIQQLIMSRGGWRRHAPARSGPRAPRREANVSPLFALSVGFGPVASPPSGAFAGTARLQDGRSRMSAAPPPRRVSRIPASERRRVDLRVAACAA